MSAPVGPYSPIVRAGEFLICSGQIGIDDGALVPGGVIAQFRQAMANAAAVLATEGATLADVVKTTVFLVHMDDFAAMNEAYIECFGDARPAPLRRRSRRPPPQCPRRNRTLGPRRLIGGGWQRWLLMSCRTLRPRRSRRL